MTQQLATLADLAALGPPSAVFPVGITDGVKTSHLVNASGIALSYVGKRYGLPLVSWGADLIGAVVAIAVYTLLALRRGANPSNAADGIVQKAYDDAIAWLRDVARGLAELVDTVDSTPSTSEASPLVGSEPANGWGYARRSRCC